MKEVGVFPDPENGGFRGVAEVDLPELTPLEDVPVILEFAANLRMTINPKTKEGWKVEIFPFDPQIRKKLNDLEKEINE